MAHPFITEPPSSVFIEENSTVEFVWEIDDCGWEVRIVTEKYTLHPNIDPTRVPIKIHTDYNVSITPEVCKENTTNTNVTLSIIFKASVLEYIEYIICKVFRRDETMHKSRVNLTTTAPPHTEITLMTLISSTNNIIIPTDTYTFSFETTFNSGCKKSVHFNTLIIATLFFSLHFF